MSAGTLEAVLTPVERHGELWLKREDLWEERSPGDGCIIALGAKARTAGIICRAVLEEGGRGIAVALDRNSSVPGMLSRVCRANGVELHVYLPAHADPWPTPFFEAHANGAHLHEVRPGYMSVRRARLLEQLAGAPHLREVKLGLAYMTAGLMATAAQVDNVPEFDVKRIVVPVGSGRMLEGVVAGLFARCGTGRLRPSVLGVCCGRPPKAFDNLFHPWLEIVPAGVPFNNTVAGSIDGVPLDETYEAKCLPFLQSGDLLWVVANRKTE